MLRQRAEIVITTARALLFLQHVSSTALFPVREDLVSLHHTTSAAFTHVQLRLPIIALIQETHMRFRLFPRKELGVSLRLASSVLPIEPPNVPCDVGQAFVKKRKSTATMATGTMLSTSDPRSSCYRSCQYPVYDDRSACVSLYMYIYIYIYICTHIYTYIYTLLSFRSSAAPSRRTSLCE
jgi:hypothetical protein